MVEQGYNYLDGFFQSMAELFETRIENLGRFDSKKYSDKEKKNKANKEKKTSPTIMFLQKRVLKEQKMARNIDSITIRVVTVPKNAQLSRPWFKRRNSRRKRLRRKGSTPNMK